MSRSVHWLCGCILSLAFAALLSRGEEPDSTKGTHDDARRTRLFAEKVQPFLKSHCLRCHNEEKLTSGVRVDHLNAGLEERQLKLWEAIRQQVAKRAMPPEDEPQPADDVRAAVVAWIDQSLHDAQSRPAPKNGGARRLTVAQYRNTLRELLLLEEDLASSLPPDAVSKDGFLNNQETLSLSPLLLEAYFDIAGKALAQSIVDPKRKPRIQNFRVDLGEKINSDPCPDKLILGAESLLLKNEDFVVRQLTASKPFPFEPVFMRTKQRFIEGYQGNDTVRGWREFDSIYHSVFACLRGAPGYPKGRAYEVVPEGLLLRPAIPSEEVFRVESTYGPRANFKISLRELPDFGRFRVTVTAAKFADALLLDPKDPTALGKDEETAIAIAPTPEPKSIAIPEAGIYQVDVFRDEQQRTEKTPPSKADDKKPQELTIILGERRFTGNLSSPAFLVVRLAAGEVVLAATLAGPSPLTSIRFTKLNPDHALARRFAAFEKRSPRVGVHLGLRRDCGSTLNPVGIPQNVPDTKLAKYVFEGDIRNFPSPDVEEDNVNYLAGIREIGVRSEYTDGRDMPRLLLQSVEFEGPYYDNWPPAAHRNLFHESASQDDPLRYGREIIRHFATRAFRRPVTPDEESAIFGIFKRSLDSGSTFEESVKDALQVVLTSPQFLMLVETSASPAPEPLDDYELASKLSYFLWNGPPDDTLLQRAAKGELRKHLRSEVTRMLEDARLERFTTEFVTQWLALEKFAVLEPDRNRFPRLTRDVRMQLREEPIQFVQHLLQKNLPVRNLIASDFVLANESVASYYELEEKPDSGFNFVPVLHARQELGGLLSQASILAGLSDGRESNPVKRGAWLARRIVAMPPDDPPPNVPTLKEEGQLSLRERLERHRNQAGCAQCHSKIDPWGLPLEEFDAGGRWKSAPVDARSLLPDKKEVAGFADLRNHLAEEQIDQVAFCVLKHLATYATGRTLAYNELEYLRREGLKRKADGYRMRDLVWFVIDSPIFLEK